MESGDEETAQKSSRRGTRQAGRPGAQRGQTARQPRKWAQGWPGQKSQEDYCRPPRRAASAPWPPAVIEIVIASIRARFGDGVIGLGGRGIRFGRSMSHARTG